ncbi:MAG TPA: hypothetical protein VFM02_00230 [Candidatus Paceibacterota bacterium]|nr:hypothetical protein [Candidatus Paceibacterota bacterium]
MHIVSVAPFAGNLTKSALSYFTKEPITPGTLIKIPLRKKSVYAIVLESTDLKNAKTRLRTSDFRLRKIDGVVRENFFTPAFLSAVSQTAEYYGCQFGQLLPVFAPALMLDLVTSFSETKNPAEGEESSKNTDIKKPLRQLVQVPEKERFQAYLRIIKKTQKREESVFLAVPDRVSGENLFHFLTEHLPHPSSLVFLHGNLPKKQLRENLKRVLSGSLPLVIIGTPSFFATPHGKVGAIILENESSELYRSQKQPYPDARVFVLEYANAANIDFFLGASVLRTETLELLQSENFEKTAAFQTELSLPEKVFLADMTKYRESDKKFRIFAESTERLLAKNLEEKKKVFIFALRKGLAGVTVCRDCTSVVLCKNCSAPMVLYESSGKNSERKFVCSRCRFTVSAREKILCETCGGFRLEALGIGIDRVRAYLKKAFPHASVAQIDGEHTKTYRQALQEKTRFCTPVDEANSAQILLGTEMAIKYLSAKEADCSIVVSLDSLFSLPDFRINEKIFSLLSSIAEKTKHELVVQTRNPEAELLQASLKGNIKTFHQEDLQDRKRFGYPPFTKIIKISFLDKQKESEVRKEKIQRFFSAYQPEIYQGFTEKIRNRYLTHALLRLPARDPLPEDLKKRLQALSPEFQIRIDPESIL